MSNLPGDTSLPIFVYGALKPGEISWPLISPHVVSHSSNFLDGFTLFSLDSIPTAVKKTGRYIDGELLILRDSAQAYKAIAAFENVPQHYVWEQGSCSGRAVNFLVATSVIETRSEEIPDWSSSMDPYFGFLIPYSYQELTRISDGIKNKANLMEYHDDFLALQGLFMLLWTLTERIMLFRQGPRPQHETLQMAVQRLASQPEWRDALAGAQITQDLEVRSNRDSYSQRATVTGRRGFDAWYKARGNVVHRGKGAKNETRSLLRIAKDLHNTLACFLQQQLPSIRNSWAQNLEVDLTTNDEMMQTSWLYKISL